MASHTGRVLVVSIIAAAATLLAGCQSSASQREPAKTHATSKPTPQSRPAKPVASQPTSKTSTTKSADTHPVAVQPAPQPGRQQQTTAATKTEALPRRETYTPRPYPVDERGFSPVDRALAGAYACEEKIDDDGSLNPYVMKVIGAYPLDGSYPYHCSWKPREYDIYNGVTQDMWFKGMVVAKAYPDGSRCSYCCGFTFEVFIRAMKLRNIQKGLDPDDFNNMTFHDLFNLLQLWYIEGKGDSPQLGIEVYGLGQAITDFEQARPGDFLDYSTTPPGGHSAIFIEWLRDDAGKIIGLRYFSSNLSGTNGVGFGSGKFSDSNGGKGILRKSLRLARVGGIESYRPFDRKTIPQRNAYAPTQPERVIYSPAPTGEGK